MTVEPALFVNDIVSPTFKSVLKFVPLPKRFAELFAIDILPVIVSFVPAIGPPAIYKVTASVVVTLVLEAANVGISMLLNTIADAVPLPAVSLSVKVLVESLKYCPTNPGMPDFVEYISNGPPTYRLLAIATPPEKVAPPPDVGLVASVTSFDTNLGKVKVLEPYVIEDGLCTIPVPLPSSTALEVNVLAPVPPLETGSTPVTPVVRSTDAGDWNVGAAPTPLDVRMNPVVDGVIPVNALVPLPIRI